jgi:hypothetical protein
MTRLYCLGFAVLLVLGGCVTTHKPAVQSGSSAMDPDNFFNGKDLTGWTSTIPEYWSVEDGVIVGRSDKPIPRNEFIWSGVEVKDFYLALDVKLEPNECNAGIQFRSQKHPPFEALGYQADVGKGVWGRLYHESGRKKLFWLDRGEQAVKPGEWNRYEILAVGDRIWTAINGTLAVAVRDPQGERAGYIALQMHSGPPMTVRYKLLKLVHDPAVKLAGMDEKQLDAALVAPDVDDGKPALPRTRPATKPVDTKRTEVKQLGTEEKKAGGSSAAASSKPQAAAAPKDSAPSPALANAPVPAKSGPLSDVPPQRRFADAPTTLPAPIAGYDNGKFSITPGEVIVFAGQTNMVRQQQVGELEAQLAVAFADQKPRFRSMAWEGDTVYQQWRDLNFGGWQAQLDWAGATAIIAWFGQTEALDGKEKLPDFIDAYGKLIDEWSKRTKRIVLVSPMMFENKREPKAQPGSTSLPDLSPRNKDVQAYCDAIRDLATARGLVFVDARYDPDSLTTNGLHLSQEGQKVFGREIAKALGVEPRPAAKLAPLAAAIVDKNQLWFDNWRPMNWAFAYGDRQHVPYSKAIGDHPPLKIEFEDFKPLIKTADEKIHELAQSAK